MRARRRLSARVVEILINQWALFFSSWLAGSADMSRYVIRPSDSRVHNEAPHTTLTAGSAKKEMPSKAQKEAMILPGQVIGTVSP